MFKWTKSVAFRSLSIFLTFTILWSGVSYAAGGDISTCLNTATPFPQINTEKGDTINLPYTLTEKSFRDEQYARPFLFLMIAKALEKQNRLTDSDLVALINQHLIHFIQTDSFKGLNWQGLSKEKNAFYLPVEISGQTCKLKFSRIKRSDRNKPQFLEVIDINDGLVGVEVVGLDVSAIDKDIIDAFHLAVKMGKKKLAEAEPEADDITSTIERVKTAIISRLERGQERSYVTSPHHGSFHIDALIEKARILANEGAFDESKVDWEVLTAAICLHDIRFDSVDHAAFGADVAKDFLQQYQLLADWQIQKVWNAIAFHEVRCDVGAYNRKKFGLEAQILYDVDQWDAFGIQGIYRNIAVCAIRKANYRTIGHTLQSRYSTLTFDATKKLSKSGYDTAISFFQKLNREFVTNGSAINETTKSGARGVVYYISQNPYNLSQRFLQNIIDELTSIAQKKPDGTTEKTEYLYTLNYFKTLAGATSPAITLRKPDQPANPLQLIETVFKAVKDNLPIVVSHRSKHVPKDTKDIKGTDEEKGGYLDSGRTLADHILVPAYIANGLSILTLPAGLYSTWTVLKFMYFSQATLISLSIWILSFLVSVGWHERGHYIEAIKARTLRDDLLSKAEQMLYESSPVNRFLWNLKIVFLSPFGFFPGIGRKGLTYYVEAPYNLKVAAAGPRASRQLSIAGLILAVIGISLGVGYGLPFVLYLGRVCLGFGVPALLDFFFADPGEYKKFKQQEEQARKAGQVDEKKQVEVSEWKDKVESVKQFMIKNRMHEVLLAGGEKLRAPWQLRNSGMGGRHTEKEYPESNISMQETMFVPISPKNYGDAQEMTVRLQNRLKQIISKTEGCRVMGIGLEGGLAPYITKEEGDRVPEQRLWRMAKQAILDCGYNKDGKIDVAIALDPAASELQNAYRDHSNQPNVIGSYRFWRATEKVDMTRDELLDLYRKAIEEDGIPIISIEDGFAEDDDAGWKMLMGKFGKKLFVIGDDSVTTRDSSIERAADLGLNNTFLCKANQIGTLSETLLAILVALGKDLQIVVSHRSKSPNDDMEAQIALACEALGLKAGGGANTERLVKYGSVMRTMAKAVDEAKAKLEKIISRDESLGSSVEDLVNRMVITSILAEEEATNAGIPTVGVEISFGIKGNARYKDFFTFRGATPLGTSAGTGEAIHLVDSIIYREQIPGEKYIDLFKKTEDGSYRFKKDITEERVNAYKNDELSELYRRAMRYDGKGCLNAVDNVKNILAKAFVGKTLSELGNLADIDRGMLAMEKDLAIKRGQLKDGAKWDEQVEAMQRKGNIGMNAILSQSLAMGRLIAHMQGKELRDILRETLKETMAKTIASNGGRKILNDAVAAKVKPEQGTMLWQILKRDLSFDELKEGLQAVNRNKPENVKLYELLRKELAVYGDASFGGTELSGETEQGEMPSGSTKDSGIDHKKDEGFRKGFMEKIWIIANHVSDSFCETVIFSVFSLPKGLHSRGAILRFMFFSPNTILTVIIWFFAVYLAIGWHERGHYIQAIKTRTLKKNLLDDAVKNLEETNIIKKLFWHLKILALGPLGLFPGIVRKGLTYYVDAPYNLSVAAAGPRASRNLGFFTGLPLAALMIPLGMWQGLPLMIYFGRWFLAFGEMGTLDWLFTDPGEYKKFKQQEKQARDAAKSKAAAEKKKPSGTWKDKMAEVKQRMIDNRMHEVLLAGGEKLRAPWQLRNSGMGGRHTEKEYPESNISMQETMFVPISPKNYGDAQEMTIRLQNRLKQIISKTDGCRVMGIGLEGGLAPYITKEKGDLVPEQRLWRMAKQAIIECGYNKGGKVDVAIALDPAASELQIAYRDYSDQEDAIGMYRFWRATEKVNMSREELLDIYRKAIEEDDIPIISIEDGFAEDDDMGWKSIMKKYGKKLFIIGDDSVTTRDSSIERAADLGLNNTFLCKANQIGTLSETLLAILVALGKDLQIVVSHRSKSPNDDMEAQIALACEALGLKAGGGANTERLVKYGSIMRTMAKAVDEAKAKLEKLISRDESLGSSVEDLVKRMVITSILAEEEATNAGIPTVGVAISFGIKDDERYKNFFTFRGATPLGTSAGTGEAIHLVDSIIYRDQIRNEKYMDLFKQVNDGSYRFRDDVDSAKIDEYGDGALSELYRRAMRYDGKGCLNAVDNVKNILAKAFVGKTLSELGNLAEIDREMLAMEKEVAIKRGQLTTDATWDEQVEIMQRKGNLGMNAILSQSLAMGRLIAHMQGKELRDILRETLKETMAKTIAANVTMSNLPEEILEKVQPRTDQDLWQAMVESLSFDELKKGLQVVNQQKPEEVKLYELLRAQLPVYGDKSDGEPHQTVPKSAPQMPLDDDNLAMMKGEIPHRKSTPEVTAVNDVVGPAFTIDKTMRDNTKTARTIVGKYLKRKDIKEKLKSIVDTEELLQQLSAMHFYVNDKPGNTSPCLVIKDRNNYQPAHVGLARKSAYFQNVLIEDLWSNKSELLAVLYTRELACLYMARDVYNGSNYNMAIQQGEAFGKKVAETLAGDSLARYVQDKVDEHIRENQEDILLYSGEVTPEMRFSVGEKALLLAGIEQYLQKQGSMEVNIPAWFVLPVEEAHKMRKNENMMDWHRLEFDEKLTGIAKGSNLEFGNAEHPLLVAVRDSNPIDRPGRGCSVLNVGITDKTVAGLAKLLDSKEFAYKFYAGLIRNLAVESGKAEPEDFEDKALVSKTRQMETESEYKWRVRASKLMYREKTGQAFPQDPYEQLNLAMSIAAFYKHAGDKAVGPYETNAVMIQRMSYGVSSDSFMGTATSRDPVTGNKKIVISAEDVQGKGIRIEDIAKQDKSSGIWEKMPQFMEQAEKYIKNMALIEFIIERDIETQNFTLNLLQVKNGLTSKKACVKILYDLVAEGIITKEEAIVRLDGIHLETLKYEPVEEVPEGAVYVGRGVVASPGVTIGAAVFSEEKAQEYREKGIPAILVKPIITAIDEGAIRISAGVIALEKFGRHVQDLSFKYRVPALVDIDNASFDENTHEITLGTGRNMRRIEEGKSVLMLWPDGEVYLKEMELSGLKDENLVTRKSSLEPFLVEVMCWHMEEEGYVPELIVDRYGSGMDWSKILRNQRISLDEYNKIKDQKRSDGQLTLQRVTDVVRSETKKRKIKVVKRQISDATVNDLAGQVIKLKTQIDQFTYFLWEIYDNFGQKAAEKEGLTYKTKDERIEYTNLEDQRGKFIKKIAEEAPEAFVQAVFYGVARDVMARYIFRSLVVDYLDDSEARQFFKRVISYGLKYGYSGDDRAQDYQPARLFAHFAKIDPDFAAQAIVELNPKERVFLLKDLETFYLTRNLRTKSFDKGFADFGELLNVLNLASNKDAGFNSASQELREGLTKKVQQEEAAEISRMAAAQITHTIESLKTLLSLVGQDFKETASDLTSAIVKLNAEEETKPNALILYADDMIEKGVVLDMEETLKNTALGEKKIFSNGQIILYAKKRDKDDVGIRGLKSLIEKADPTIKVSVVAKSELNGSTRQDFEGAQEMLALKQLALQKLNRDATVRPDEKQILGIFRGHSDDINALYEASKEVRVPVIIYGSIPGVYSFAEALKEAIGIRNNPEAGNWYKYLEMPVERLSTEKIRKEFTTHVSQILIKA